MLLGKFVFEFSVCLSCMKEPTELPRSLDDELYH